MPRDAMNGATLSRDTNSEWLTVKKQQSTIARNSGTTSGSRGRL